MPPSRSAVLMCYSRKCAGLGKFLNIWNILGVFNGSSNLAVVHIAHLQAHTYVYMLNDKDIIACSISLHGAHMYQTYVHEFILYSHLMYSVL